MAGRLKAIEQENGPLNKYDQQTDIDVGQSDKIDMVIDSLEITINGVTYTATKKPIQEVKLLKIRQTPSLLRGLFFVIEINTFNTIKFSLNIDNLLDDIKNLYYI